MSALKKSPLWLKFAVIDDQKRPIANLANAGVALRHEPGLRGAFSFDEMKSIVLVNRKLPSAESSKKGVGQALPRPLTDADIIAVQEFMQHEGLPRIGREAIRDAIGLVAREHGFDPLQDYLSGLQWDEKPRLDTWLSTYLSAADSEYTRAIGRMFLVSAVARGLKPGCKVDYVLVLQGAQGDEKSKACAVLGGKWFSDALPDIRLKDSQQFLRGKWFIEIAELAALSRSESEYMKAFITRANEDYRPSYGGQFVDEPRRCLFVATTNKDLFLKDETGGRRFWPVKVHEAHIESLSADRDQLFAEAVAAFRGGEVWWPTKEFERRVFKSEQESSYEPDIWETEIQTFLEGKDRVQISEIARDALKIATDRAGTAQQRRIAAVLERLKWKRVNDWRGRAYVRAGQ